VQVAVGGAQVLTRLDAWTQTLHLALGAVIWAALAGLTVTSYYAVRSAAGVESSGGAGQPAGTRSTGDTVRAYIALTKPRIIELLLVTTVPAMVLATRDLPGATGGVDWAAAPTRSTAISTATSTCSWRERAGARCRRTRSSRSAPSCSAWPSA
jgi:heme A synthase